MAKISSSVNQCWRRNEEERAEEEAVEGGGGGGGGGNKGCIQKGEQC